MTSYFDKQIIPHFFQWAHIKLAPGSFWDTLTRSGITPSFLEQAFPGLSGTCPAQRCSQLLLHWTSILWGEWQFIFRNQVRVTCVLVTTGKAMLLDPCGHQGWELRRQTNVFTCARTELFFTAQPRSHTACPVLPSPMKFRVSVSRGSYLLRGLHFYLRSLEIIFKQHLIKLLRFPIDHIHVSTEAWYMYTL